MSGPLTPGMTEASLRARQARALLIERLVFADSSATATALCAQWIEEPPDALRNTDVHELIESCYGVSPALADRIQTANRLFKAVRLGALTHGQRCALAATLRLYGAGAKPRNRTRRRAA